MTLKSDSYDPSEELERLVRQARYAVGEPGWRVVGPELEAFIRYEVADSLFSAFSKAEGLYISEAIKLSHQQSVTVLEAVLTGITLREGQEGQE